MRALTLSCLSLLVLATACSGVSSRGGPSDPEFFRLPLVPPEGEVREEGPVSAATAPGYRMDFEVRRTDLEIPHVYGPSLSVLAGQRGSVSLYDQVSFIQDFDVEAKVEQGAFTADPIVGILQSGLVLEVIPRPVPGSNRVAFSWAVRITDAPLPYRVRKVGLGVGEPVTIQFPVVQESRVGGRTLVTPGEHTLLAEFPLGDGSVEVAVRVEPAEIPADVDATFFLGPDARIAEPERLIPEIGHRAPPARAGLLDVSVVKLRSALPSARLHMDRSSAERTLGDLATGTIRRFRVRTEPETGAKLVCLLNKSYLQDFDVRVDSKAMVILDPIVSTVDAGLTAEVEEGKDAPVVRFRLTSLVGFGEFTTDLNGANPVTIELPETVECSGELTLRSTVDVAALGRLTTGEHLALVVRRVEP